jgi:uncharacterized lipoprotein
VIRFPLLLLLVSLTAGCALTTDEVALDYQPLAPAVAVPGAQNILVTVNYAEGRSSNLERVSVKKNGYGMEMASIINKQPIPQLVKSAIEGELRARGFQIGAGTVFVNVELDKFFNDFKIGFFSGDAVSEVTISCQVKTAAGAILYARTVTGRADVPGVMLASGTNAKLSLDKAFPAAVSQFMSDPNFIRALLHAGTPVAQGMQAGRVSLPTS